MNTMLEILFTVLRWWRKRRDTPNAMQRDWLRRRREARVKTGYTIPIWHEAIEKGWEQEPT